MPRTVRYSAVLLLAFGAALALPAHPSDAQSVGTVSVSRTHDDVQNDYGPIVADNPQETLVHTPSQCKTAAWCDLLNIKVDSSAFASNDFWQVVVTLSWQDAGGANDVDLYLYDANQKKIGQSSGADNPEVASIDSPPSATYYAVANNSSGPNTGYTIEVEMQYLGKAKAIPKFTGAPPTPRFTPLPPLATAAPPASASAIPAPTLQPVLTPGPNGSPTSLSLEGVEAGPAVKKGGGLTWWGYVIMSVAIAAVAGGTGFIVLRRVRGSQ